MGKARPRWQCGHDRISSLLLRDMVFEWGMIGVSNEDWAILQYQLSLVLDALWCDVVPVGRSFLPAAMNTAGRPDTNTGVHSSPLRKVPNTGTQRPRSALRKSHLPSPIRKKSVSFDKANVEVHEVPKAPRREQAKLWIQRLTKQVASEESRGLERHNPAGMEKYFRNYRKAVESVLREQEIWRKHRFLSGMVCLDEHLAEAYRKHTNSTRWAAVRVGERDAQAARRYCESSSQLYQLVGKNNCAGQLMRKRSGKALRSMIRSLTLQSN